MFSKQITKLSFALVACIAIIFSACKSEQKLALKFSPEVSKKYEMTMNTVQDIDMEQMGQKMHMKNDISMTYVMEVKEKDANNNIVMVSTFKKVKFISTTPMGEMGFDSDKGADTSNMFSSMFSKIFGGLVDQQMTIVVNEKGEVTEVKGMAEIFNNMIKSSGLDTIPTAAASLEAFKQQFSDEQFKKNFDESFNILPKTDVAIGDSWDINNNKNLMNMDVNTKTKYTLKSVEGDMAVVDIASDFTVEKNGEDAGGVEMNMKGTQTGTMKINTKTGLAADAKIDQDITATSKTMGMEIPMTIKGSIVISSKEIK